MNNKISIATSCYNNEYFLNDFFLSLMNQTYGIEHLEIIVVNDGSTDNSGELLERWQKQYPDNIKIITTENRGQSEGRNEALNHVTSKWVTFIDCDDFINPEYFFEINDAINKYRECYLFTGNLVTYFADKEEYGKIHYSNENVTNMRHNIIRFNENHKAVKLSVSSTVLNYDIIKTNNLQFKDIKPAWEDTRFLMDYYKLLRKKIICYSKDVSYFYRKTENFKSTTNNMLENEDYYTTFFENGVIPLLKEYEDVPGYVQQKILETTQWHLRGNYHTKMNITLTEEKKKNLIRYYKYIFSKVSNEILIDNKNYYPIDLYRGIIINFKPELSKELKCVEYFYTTDKYNIFKIYHNKNSNIEVIYEDDTIKYLSELLHKSFEEELFEEYMYTVTKLYVPHNENKIDNIRINEYEYTCELPEDWVYPLKNEKPIFLFMDRIDFAGDNAEVLYEWFLQNTEYSDLYFAIDFKSEDYLRLKKKGFKLINYKSKKFETVYTNADYIFSSHADQYIINNNQYRNNNPKSVFTFLQHGTIMDDMTTWLKDKKLDYIVVSGNTEENIIKDLYHQEILNVGMPRLGRTYDSEENILYAPGWSINYNRMTKVAFENSTKLEDIISILNDIKIQEYLISTKKRLFVKIHPNLLKKLNVLNITLDEEYYEKRNIIIADSDYIDLFQQCNVVITDFSSVFIDHFFNKNKVAFLQRNPSEFYKSHTSKPLKRYKNYGPVFTEIEDIKDFIIKNKEYDNSKYLEYREKNMKHIEKNTICEKIYRRVVLNEKIS